MNSDMIEAYKIIKELTNRLAEGHKDLIYYRPTIRKEVKEKVMNWVHDYGWTGITFEENVEDAVTHMVIHGSKEKINTARYKPLREVLSMNSRELGEWWRDLNEAPSILISEYMAKDPALIRQLLQMDPEIINYSVLIMEVQASIRIYGLDVVWEDYVQTHQERNEGGNI